MKKIIAVIVIMFLAWGITACAVDSMASKPDEIYEMCNQHITWNTVRN